MEFTPAEVERLNQKPEAEVVQALLKVGLNLDHCAELLFIALHRKGIKPKDIVEGVKLVLTLHGALKTATQLKQEKPLSTRPVNILQVFLNSRKKRGLSVPEEIQKAIESLESPPNKLAELPPAQRVGKTTLTDDLKALGLLVPAKKRR